MGALWGIELVSSVVRDLTSTMIGISYGVERIALLKGLTKANSLFHSRNPVGGAFSHIISSCASEENSSLEIEFVNVKGLFLFKFLTDHINECCNIII